MCNKIYNTHLLIFDFRFLSVGPSFHRQVIKFGFLFFGELVFFLNKADFPLTLSMVATSSRMMVVMCRTTIPASINIVAS